jgi:hypothetical protein
MDTQIVAVYCICDDLLQALHHQNDSQCQMSDSEVMTTAIVAMLYFGGNFERARDHLLEYGYVPQMLSKSRFNRRLHRIGHLTLSLFATLAEVFKQWNDESLYLIDSLPIAVCDNYRIPHAKLYQDEAYRGYQASKKRYFYGLKVHLLVTKDHEPVEFFLTPGAESDTKALESFALDLPVGAQIFGDKAYNHYVVEDVLHECGIELLPMRKRNSKRPLPPWMRYLQAHYRKQVETAGSLLEQLLPKSIHAVTPAGFELKLCLFMVALSLNCFLFE